jgi:chromosome segregation ATPase
MIKGNNIIENEKNVQTEPNEKTRYNRFDKIIIRNKLEYKRPKKNKTFLKMFSVNKESVANNKKSQFPTLKLISKKSSTSVTSKDSWCSDMFSTKIENQTEKEKIISEIFKIQSEIYDKDEELKQYNKIYRKLEEHNMTFKAILERILKTGEEENTNQNINDNDNNNDNNNNIKDEEMKNNIRQRQISMLKFQIESYDKSIEEKDKILDETKKGKKINNFIIINSLINQKNKELENLITNTQKLQYSQHGIDKRLDFLISSIKKYKEYNSKLEQKLKINEKDNKYYKDEYEISLKEIENYNSKIIKLENELKLLEDQKLNKRERLNEIIQVYEKDKNLEEEEEIINNNLDNINIKAENIKKIIEKNKTKINIIKVENQVLENDLNIYKQEADKLNEKYKINQINKQNMKTYEKEKEKIKEELRKNKIEYEKILKKNIEDKERIKMEIEEFEKAKISLINKINELNRELKEKTEKNISIEEQLTKVNQKYNNIIKDKNS